MPPSSNKPLISSLSRQTYLGSSPDNDSGSTEPELQPKLSKSARKKQARNAAKAVWDDDTIDKPLEHDVTTLEPPPAAPPPPQPVLAAVAAPPQPPAPAPASSLLSQIPHTFPKPHKVSAPLSSDEHSGDAVGEKVSDQATPPYDDFFRNASQGRPLVRETATYASSTHNSPPAQPGFSTRSGFPTRSPPISPPQRYVRPVSYGGNIPPLPIHSRMPYSRPQSQYGSPPAPHMPQPHFYHAQDVDVPLPPQFAGNEAQEPTLFKHTLLPNYTSETRSGVLLGYDGRVSILATGRGRAQEISALTDLPGTVIDACLLPSVRPSAAHEKHDNLIALVLHGARSTEDLVDQFDSAPGIPGYPAATTTTTEYITSIEVYSLDKQQHVATILESPAIHVRSYRGTNSDVPPPIGNFRLLCSGAYLVVASGTSGEVFVFNNTTADTGQFECLAKLWTTVQHQLKRRDSSHGRSSDTDMSPADPNRGLASVERAIVDLNGRWLALSPTCLPSRPTVNAILGPNVLCRKHSGIESITAPSKPSISCEVDSPDADSMLGKVARGVAQELVKGARWLGDQGYQTWQNYWKKDQSPPNTLSQQHQLQPFSPPTLLAQRPNNAFPPTHADALPASKEPDLVSIYDLYHLRDTGTKRKPDELKPVATFQPPRGCSFVSFAPTGLNLLTSGRKGDVQYLWDLMQIHYCRAFVAVAEDDRLNAQPRVRQIARFERLSGSTVVDIAWEHPGGNRFAILTKNRTIHLFDVPSSSMRWPPPRTARRSKPSTTSADNANGTQDNNQGGFLASAMSIASKAQPMVSGWRGRAPSMGGGLAGIGQTSIGIATATGARSGKAVAAGLSKSLGAASETVSHIRHAGESRLHIKSSREPTPGKIVWLTRGHHASLSVLDLETIKAYGVRKNKLQDRGNRDSTSVFDTRKANTVKLPRYHELRSAFEEPTRVDTLADAGHVPATYPGFCMLDSGVKPQPLGTAHPLSHAEIESNAPYQPFHSDRRVALCVFTEPEIPQPSQWAFGDDVPLSRVNLTRLQIVDDDEGQDSIIYRETTMSSDGGQGGMEHIVSTTRRGRKKKVGAGDLSGRHGIEDDEEGLMKDDFFEDDCEVLDFATDRV